MEHEFVSQHGSVAEEVAALVEAIRAGSRRGEQTAGSARSDHEPGKGGKRADCTCDCEHTTLDVCQICPVCRSIGALHAISPTAVSALADLAHQAEVTLRALAVDLHQQQGEPAAPPREDIPVTDLDED